MSNKKVFFTSHNFQMTFSTKIIPYNSKRTREFCWKITNNSLMKRYIVTELVCTCSWLAFSTILINNLLVWTMCNCAYNRCYKMSLWCIKWASRLVLFCVLTSSIYNNHFTSISRGVWSDKIRDYKRKITLFLIGVYQP